MTTKELLERIDKIDKDCVAIIKAKSADYAHPDSDTMSNFRNSTAVGVSLERGILVRIMDKISRIANLLDKEAVVKDEKIEDTLLDLINYSKILLCHLSNQNKPKTSHEETDIDFEKRIDKVVFNNISKTERRMIANKTLKNKSMTTHSEF